MNGLIPTIIKTCIQTIKLPFSFAADGLDIVIDGKCKDKPRTIKQLEKVVNTISNIKK